MRTDPRQHLDSGTEDRNYLESLIREEFRAMPSRRDAARSQAARVLFEGGPRPAAGPDGGSSGSRRTQGQGIAIVAGSNGDRKLTTITFNPAKPPHRAAATRRQPIAPAQRACAVDALRFPVRRAGARHVEHGVISLICRASSHPLMPSPRLTSVSSARHPSRPSQKVDKAASPDETEQGYPQPITSTGATQRAPKIGPLEIPGNLRMCRTFRGRALLASFPMFTGRRRLATTCLVWRDVVHISSVRNRSFGRWPKVVASAARSVFGLFPTEKVGSLDRV